MAESKTAYLDDHHLEAIQDMVERGEAGNESEALRNFINEGMSNYGYRAGRNGNTTLKWMSKEFARLFSYSGMAWIVFFWAFPVQFALPGVMLLFAALSMIASYLALDRYEPAVSHYLFSRGDKA